MRIEKDALGEIEVADDRYWGAQTERALANFRVGDERMPLELVKAHAIVKKAAAVANEKQGRLDAGRAAAIREAADEVIAGRFDDHFPLPIYQSGSGTQTNMNVNEVIANRASELMGGRRGEKSPVHPNDHVNRSQSTNDTIPTSMHVASVLAIEERLLPALDRLTAAFDGKAREFARIVKIGRTHHQDATPLMLGQEMKGYAAQLRHARGAIEAVLPPLTRLAVGGTAVGTGLNTREGFDRLVCEEISRLTGRKFRPMETKFAGLAAHDEIVSASGALRTLAAALLKIANDVRLLGSGPRSGLGELTLPANEPGSSIMPGKVNPTQCEMVTMVCAQVFGNDAAVAFAGSQGTLELNVMKPLLAARILQSVGLLADAATSFADRCVSGIEANEDRIRALVGGSLMLVTALNRRIGYDRAAEIALAAWREGKTLREAAKASGHLTGEQFDEWVRPEEMTRPEDGSADSG